jgi:hypothetical protein
MKRHLPTMESFHVWKSTAAEPSNWTLVRHSSGRKQPLPVQSYTRLALWPGRPALGSTFFLLDQLDEPALRILWPKSAIVRAAFADGHRVTPIPAEEGQIAIPIRADGHKHRVAIHWSESTNSPLSTLGKVAEQIPVAAVHSAPTALLAVSVPPEFHLFVPAGFQELEPQAFANECDAIASAEAEPAADAASQWAESRSFNADAGRRMLGRITLKTPSPAIEFWAFRTALLTIPLAVAVFALVMMVLTRLVRSGAGRLLTDRQPLWLAMIGAAWWLCASPRVLGLLLLAASLVVWIVARKRSQSRPGRTLPSTVHIPV